MGWESKKGWSWHFCRTLGLRILERRTEIAGASMYEVQSCWKGGCLGLESEDGRSASERSGVVVQDVLQQLVYGSFNPKA